MTEPYVRSPGARTVAPVLCVEAGRWEGQPGQVRSGRRASLLVGATQSFRSGHGRQQRVWDRVETLNDSFGRSPTSSLIDHLDRRRSRIGMRSGRSTARLRRGVRALAGQRGVLVGLGGEPAYLEVFSNTAGLRRHLGPLLDACELDAALVTPRQTHGSSARSFAAGLRKLPVGMESGTIAGAGSALRVSSGGYEVRGLGWRAGVVHASVLNSHHELVGVG